MHIRPGGYDDIHAILDAGLRINTRVKPEHMLVAEDDNGELAGFAYCFLSGLHHSRYWATIRVCDGQRGKGLGTELLKALGQSRDEDRPFFAKLREDNPALGWVRAMGGVPYQVCPPMRLDLTDAANRLWVGSLPERPATARIVPGSDLSDEQLVTSFCSLYEWVHEDWSPVTSRADVERMFADEVRLDLDRRLSSFAVDGDDVVAGVFVFRTPSGEPLDVVAETITRDAPDGDAALAACVRATARQAADAGWGQIAFDGHQDDPHLYPLLQTAPKLDGVPLYLMEYAPPRD